MKIMTILLLPLLALNSQNDFNPENFDFNPNPLLLIYFLVKINFEVIVIYNYIARKLSKLLLTMGIIEDDQEIYEYGFELVLSFVTGCMLILCISLTMNRFLEGVFFLTVFISIRSFTGGYHADSHLKCNLCLCITYIVYCIIMNYCMTKSILVLEILSWIAFYIIIKYAPLTNVKKNISDIEKKIFKVKAKKITLFFKLLSFILTLIHIELYCVITYTIIAVGLMMLISIGGEKDEQNDY